MNNQPGMMYRLKAVNVYFKKNTLQEGESIHR